MAIPTRWDFDITTMLSEKKRAVDGNIHLTGFRHNHYDPGNEESCFGDFSDDYGRPKAPEATAQAAL